MSENQSVLEPLYPRLGFVTGTPGAAVHDANVMLRVGSESEGVTVSAGAVTDPGGAVVHNASVTPTNDGTTADYSLTAKDVGRFVFQQHPSSRTRSRPVIHNYQRV